MAAGRDPLTADRQMAFPAAGGGQQALGGHYGLPLRKDAAKLESDTGSPWINCGELLSYRRPSESIPSLKQALPALCARGVFPYSH